MKTCRKCGEEKPESEFYARSPGKLRAECKGCASGKIKAWRRENPELARAQQKVAYEKWAKANPERAKKVGASIFQTFYSTPHGRAVHMLNNARARAKAANVEFTLDCAWVEKRLIAGVCEATGLRLEMVSGRGKGHRTNSFSPSLERVDAAGGYTPENCIIACWIYNRAKGAFPLEDLMLMARALLAAEDRRAAA